MNHPNANNRPDVRQDELDAHSGPQPHDPITVPAAYTPTREFNLQSTSSSRPDSEASEQPPSIRSWPFQIIDFLAWLISKLFGIASVIFLLALTATIPIAQFLSFGYLLEVTGRIARGQKYQTAFVGIKKAAMVGSLVLGTWLLLIPLRLLSRFRFEATLIDSSSSQTGVMETVQAIVLVLTLAHIVASWICGGKLRYFFWPMVAPVSFAIWLLQKMASTRLPRRILDIGLGWISPHLVKDICDAKPMSDWFLPAILFKKIRSGNLLSQVRDGLWDFATSLNLPYYFVFGFKGFLGTLAWLVIPTGLLMAATNTEGGTALFSGLIGSLIAIPVFIVLPFLQAHFAVDGRMRRFIEVRKVIANMGRAPVAHFLALLLTLAFALPLFLLKIETIPAELLWSLTIVFVVFIWPAKWIVGWAYRRGTYREKKARWFIRWPALSLCLPVSFAFVFILFFTRYVTWNGALSLLENHVFLLPAPFWL